MVIILISLVRHVLPVTSPSVTLVPYPSCPSFPQNMLILHGYCMPVNCMRTCVRSRQVICQGSIRRVCKCSMLSFIKGAHQDMQFLLRGVCPKNIHDQIIEGLIDGDTVEHLLRQHDITDAWVWGEKDILDVKLTPR